MAKDSFHTFPIKKGVPIEKLTIPFQKFFKYEASSGILLIISVVFTLIWVNINASSYFGFWETYFTVSLGDFTISKAISIWINDLLMAVFFLLIGLEVKRELLVGELRDTKKAMLSISAAIGGIILPAVIYLFFNFNDSDNIRGWAIPAATDIAFALAILYLLGNRVPLSARVFLASLAIIDDLVAILIIALFYTGEVKLNYILFTTIIFLILVLMNRLNIRRIPPYVLVGTLLWYGFLVSGIHATLSGVILAITIPATTKIDHIEFREKSNNYITRLVEITNDERVSTEDLPVYINTIAALEHLCQDVEAPLQRLEHALTPWVAFLILPVFAIANASVVISRELPSLLLDDISLGIIFGLMLGKPFGILIFSYLAVRIGIAKLPANLSWAHVFGIGFLAGIGFTMSTFISALAFENDSARLEIAKLAILLVSFLSGIIGYSILRRLNQQSILKKSIDL